MISYVLVLIVSRTTGHTTQALLEGPMSLDMCEQQVREARYNDGDAVTRKSPICMSAEESVKVLTANGCLQTPGPNPHWPTLHFDCAAAREAAPALAQEPRITPSSPSAPGQRSASTHAQVPSDASSHRSAVHAHDTPEPPPRRAASGRTPHEASSSSAPTRLAVVAPPPPSQQLVAPEPPPAAPPHPAARAPYHRRYHLSAAAEALVRHAHSQAGAGDYAGATSTIERALRIDQGSSPLLWIELGRIHMAEGNAAQADGLYRKALAQAAGDSEVQARAWGLIAQSLRAQGRNEEAQDAERQADAGAGE
jgi:hypothetical protein